MVASMKRDLNFYKHRIRTHPGEILKEDYLIPLGLSVDALSLALQLPTEYLDAIVKGKEPVNANVALRLARYFETSSELWMHLQVNYDLSYVASQQADEIEKICSYSTMDNR